MGHVQDLWTTKNRESGKRVKNDRHGTGKRWQARWGVPLRTKSFESKAAAEAHVRRMDGEPDADNRITVSEWVSVWRGNQLHARDASLKSYELSLVKVLEVWGPRTLASISRQDVQDVVGSWAATLAPRTVRHRYMTVRALFSAAVEDGVLNRTPCRSISLPQLEVKKLVPLSTGEVLRIRSRMPARFQSMVTAAAATGLRIGELCGLTWDRIGNGTILVDRQMLRTGEFGPLKTRSSYRRVPVPDALMVELLEHRQKYGEGPSRLVWFMESGGPVPRSSAGDWWSRAVDGIREGRSGWHELRHYHASMLIRAGMSAVAVAARLGHASSQEVINTYEHLWHDDDARAVSATSAALWPLVEVEG